MEGELRDWELLHDSDTDSIESHPSDEGSRSSSEVDGVSFVKFRTDHFSVENLIERSGKITDANENDLVGSDESARVDSWSASLNQMKNPDKVLAGSSSGQSYEYRSSDAIVRSELWCTDVSGGEKESNTEILCATESGEVKLSNFKVAEAELAKTQVIVEEIGGSLDRDEHLSKCSFDSGNPEVTDEKHVESQAAVEETGKTLACDEDSIKYWSDSGGEMLVSNSGVISSEEIEKNEVRMIERESNAVNHDVGSGDESKRKCIVWWKMPFVLLKYCAFKIGPVWTVSVTAAVIGLALLGRRLYNVKKKAQRFQLRVTFDDKKVSRVMSQVARLNEAFTVVRRVHVLRPALPSPAVNTWPVLSLR